MIFISTELKGKMFGTPAISTNTLSNKFCIENLERAKRHYKQTGQILVCLKCYARKYEKLFPNIVKNYQANSDLLCKELNDKAIPFINNTICRFNAFGELISNLHYLNLVKIAKKNPLCTFTLWTKRSELVTGKKIKNMIYIYSSSMLNKIAELPKGFDKVFTVYDRDYISKHKVNINCHSYKGACNQCRLCYSKNDVKYINEIVK